MRWLPLLAVFVAGCASANIGGSGGKDAAIGDDDDDDAAIDAPDVVDIDAPPGIDAGVSQTLSQLTSAQNASQNSVACANQNSWYRVFPLADAGIAGGFNVTQVTFGSQEAGGSPVLTIKIGTYSGAVGGPTLDLALVTPINSATKTIANTNDPGNNVVVPITGYVPPGSNLIVEIFIPNNGANSGALFFFIGASNAGETKPSYVRLPSCVDAGGTPISIPKTTASIGSPTANLNITVTGVR